MAKQSIESLIKTLDSSKSIQKDNIPTKIIKENVDIMPSTFHDNINECFSESFFPDDLKKAEVIPIFKKNIKKDFKNLKENYRPVSILSNIFMKHVCTTNYPVILKIFFQIISSPFAKELVLTWNKYLDNKESFGVLMTDLSNTFDCLNHELLIAKRHACDLDNSY